uniref:Variant surface glycoprotein n=1 Tax=Trypanosoma brucei TaxID=5691 RepID=A0A1V0FZS6_9TRYP|nr:variant surface glycoprotein [Trypanosoma brucei]
MIKDYNDLQTNSAKLKAFNTEYGLPLSEGKRQILRSKLTKLATKAEEINSAVTSLDTTIKQTRLQLRKDLLTALYGKAAAPTINALTDPNALLTALPATQFPWDDSSTRAATCAKASNNAGKPGAALATDLVCLCVISHSAQDNTCGTAQPVTGDFSGGAGNQGAAAAAFKTLTKACDSATHTTGTELTTANIAAAISTFHADLGTNWIPQAELGNAAAHRRESTDLYSARTMWPVQHKLSAIKQAAPT